MQLRNVVIFAIAFFGFYTNSIAQEKWSLQDCIDFAMKQSLTIKQSKLAESGADLNRKLAESAKWPSLSGQGSLGEQLGRSIDPTTNQFTSNNVGFGNLGLQSGVNIFNWHSQRYNAEYAKIMAAASRVETQKVKENLALGIVNQYLLAVANFQRIDIAKLQIEQDSAQLFSTRKKVEAGSLPELEAAELEAQLARDSAAWTDAESGYKMSVFQLKTLMDVPAHQPFEIVTPNLDAFLITPIADLDPEIVFAEAIQRFAPMQLGILRVKGAKIYTKYAKALAMPAIGAFANLQTAYSTALKQLPKGANFETIVPTPAFIEFNGDKYFVNTPISVPKDFVNANLPRQLNNNFRQAIGINISIPVFNGRQNKTAYQKTLITQQNEEISLAKDTLKLRQDIHLAYQSALAANALYKSYKKVFATTINAYSLGSKRYDVGLIPIFDLITLQNNKQRAYLNMIGAHLDYVFRMKLLEYYKGVITF